MHRLRFVAELVGGAALGALLGVMGRHNDTLYFALMALGIVVCAAFLVHLVFGLRMRWKFHYVTICRVFALILVALVSFIAFANITNKTDTHAARTYLKQIKSQLETYHNNYGHYPDALDDISGLPPAPTGFRYHREKGSQPGDPDIYIIDYYSLEFSSGTARWSDDD